MSLDNQDISRIADMHIKALPTSVISRLGHRVTTAFYQYAHKAEGEILEITRDEATQKILGVAFVSSDMAALNRRLKLNPMFFFGVITSFWKVPLSTFFADGDSHLPPYNPELVYLFVDGDAQSKGLGKQLLAQVESRLANDGVGRYYVKTTDDPANRALSFYQREGFEQVNRAAQFGIQYQILAKNLSPNL